MLLDRLPLCGFVFNNVAFSGGVATSAKDEARVKLLSQGHFRVWEK